MADKLVRKDINSSWKMSSQDKQLPFGGKTQKLQRPDVTNSTDSSMKVSEKLPVGQISTNRNFFSGGSYFASQDKFGIHSLDNTFTDEKFKKSSILDKAGGSSHGLSNRVNDVPDLISSKSVSRSFASHEFSAFEYQESDSSKVDKISGSLQQKSGIFQQKSGSLQQQSGSLQLIEENVATEFPESGISENVEKDLTSGGTAATKFLQLPSYKSMKDSHGLRSNLKLSGLDELGSKTSKLVRQKPVAQPTPTPSPELNCDLNTFQHLVTASSTEGSRSDVKWDGPRSKNSGIMLAQRSFSNTVVEMSSSQRKFKRSTKGLQRNRSMRLDFFDKRYCMENHDLYIVTSSHCYEIC
ncbi:hypothetical protein SNE40_012367 [Patella caerulea]|uniref:Uncharacterized protein n=1 Tax=Patella caerulea TaxID=87958 RepID=A0AAN8JNP7_PATCE